MPVKVGLKVIEIWKSSMEDAVRRYEEEPIRKGEIVFYGPSNFTRWSEKWGMIPLREAVVGKSGAPCCINRGFGSSCSEHHLYYYSRMIRPLEPKVLVYSGFGNSENFGYTLEETWEIAQRVIVYALTDFPDIHIYICGANVRANMSDAEKAKRRECNSWAREFAENTPNCFYLDTLEYKPLQDADIFVSDGIHFNQEGYHRYAEFFRQALKDELDRF